MTNEPTFDVDAAHKYFSAACFNKAWDLIDQTDRTADEDERMIRLNQASLWHWSQRPDCTNKNMSIGYWQASRIYALLNQADNARRYAQICFDITPENEPFLVAYAYEALARAESIAGNGDKAESHVAQARKCAEAIAGVEDKQLLLNDLASIS